MENTVHRTNRTFTDVETNEKFALHMDSNTHEYSLISDGSEQFAAGTQVNGFYICSHTSCDIKLNTKKIIHLPMGTFYQPKEGEQITHRKFIGFSKFSKI